MVSQKPIAVDDRVTFRLGTAQARGVIVEDRGPIGVNHRRLFRVRVFNDPYEDQVIEMPEDELTVLQELDQPIPASESIDYLVHGGLVQILMQNSGGKNPPRVWLTYNNLGRVIHTFIEERGIVGGAIIPPLASQGNRVFAPRQEEVTRFLESFGLSATEAEHVVRQVGTSP